MYFLSHFLISTIIILCNSPLIYGADLQSSFSGYIYDESGIPLEGANIVIVDSKGNKTGSSSDQQGFFKIPLFFCRVISYYFEL